MLTALGATLPAHAASTTLISTGTPVVTGAGGLSYTTTYSTSPDGRYVAFESQAVNLSPLKTTATYRDVFVRDTQTGTTTLVSVNTAGTGSGNGGCFNPVISANGRYVFFQSQATNLTPLDTNTTNDILVRDLQTNTTTLVSVAPDGTTSGNGGSNNPGITPDGRYVTFYSNASNLLTNPNLKTTTTNSDIMVRDTQTGTTTLVSASADGTTSGNNGSFNPSISSDGRYVSFQSRATNLLTNALKTTTTYQDTFLRDTQTGTTTLISVSPDGTATGNRDSINPVISANGRYVAFDSQASNLNSLKTTNTYADIMVRDTQTGTTSLISVSADGTTSGAAGTSQFANISGDGRYVAFQSRATNLNSLKTSATYFDIFLRDTQSNTTTLISVNPAGTAAGTNNSNLPSISANGRYVAFYSTATNLNPLKTRSSFADVFVRDIQTNTTNLVSTGAGVVQSVDGNSVVTTSSNPTFSSSTTGRYVAFVSNATNLASNKTTTTYADIFLRDTQAGTTTLISVAPDGTTSGNNISNNPSVSGDGRYVVFHSRATNLLSNATIKSNSAINDVFLRDTQTGTTTLISTTPDGTGAGSSNSINPAISSDGRYVAFSSNATNLLANPLKTSTTNSDIFLRDTQTNTTSLITVGTDGAVGNQTSTNPSISSTGRYVAFISRATNLNGTKNTNTYFDAFVRDTQSNTTTLISVAPDGTTLSNNSTYNPVLSGDGRYVAFQSYATNLLSDTTIKTSSATQDVFLRDTQTNITTAISVNPNGTAVGTGGNSQNPAISGDGRYVVFESTATNLVSNKTTSTYFDVLVRDTQTNITTLISVGTDGTTAGNGNSQNANISANGRYIAFQSRATNLNANKTTNTYNDVFQRDLAVPASTGLIISEFRQRGPGGSADEYIELYNTTNATLDVSGWMVQCTSSGTVQTLTIPTGTSVPALGHYLITGSAYSLANYGGTGAAGGNQSLGNATSGNQTLNVDMTDGSPITLLNPSNVAQDTVTFGTTLSSAPTAPGEYAFVRQANPTTSLPVPTANAFIFVGTTNTSYSGTNGNITPALGAPGPENLASPRALLPLKVTLLDPAVAQTASPNRVRVGSGASGTLSIRRLVTNNTGAAINKLRFRIVNLTTLNSSGYSDSTQCDLRGAASSFSTSSIATSGGSVTVYGTTPDTTIAQNLGNGINSSSVETASGVVTLSTSLGAGATRAYDFTFNVVRPGNFTILFLFEEANGTSSSVNALSAKPANSMVVKPSVLGKSPTLNTLGK